MNLTFDAAAADAELSAMRSNPYVRLSAPIENGERERDAMTVLSNDFVPRVPTIREALGIDWCNLFGGVVHIGGWQDGWVTTLTEDDDGNETCYGQTEYKLSDLRAWRDRKLLGSPVCQHCLDQQTRYESLKEC